MRLLTLLLLSTIIFASDLLTNYRMHGINKIEKQMDLDLSKKQYWSKYLQDKDTSFGYLESYKNILTCNKDKSTLNFYSISEDKKFKLAKEYSAFTGKIKGDKLTEGDRRTPIGIYTIVQKLSKDTNLNEFYGPLAFVTSYPNLYDSYRGKDGHGIWIHGFPTHEDRDEFTRGCIAINNKSIECLNKNIDITKTLLIINKNKVNQNIDKNTLSSILAQLYKWRYSWLYNDISTYLSFYHKDFVRNDKMRYKAFKNYKTRVFKKIEKKSIIFNDINVIPYPSQTNTFEITFKEFYKSDSFKFTGNKTLIIRLDNNNNIKILTEK
jgi:murein L,D-transpeptidase YafK